MINADAFLSSLSNVQSLNPQSNEDGLHPALRRAAELGLLIAPTDSHSRFAMPAKCRLKPASRDIEDLSKWVSIFPRANWFVETGRKAGLVILEIDLTICRPSLHALSANDEEDWHKTIQFSSGVSRSLLFRIGWRRKVRFLGQRFPGLKLFNGMPVFLPPSTFVTGQPLTYTKIGAHLLPAPEWLLEPEGGLGNVSCGLLHSDQLYRRDLGEPLPACSNVV